MSMQSIGPYQLLEELGRGAMGVVFRGFDPAVGRSVAIKIMRADQFASPEESSDLKLRFAREALAAGKLSHPNIVTIHQLGEEGDRQYLVLELVNGCSLERTLSNGQPQEQKTAISILAQVADALDYAHSEGIVHRDVKPANILVRPDGKAKITDFGIARIASQTVTRTGFTFGTPSYMSPEQVLTAKVSGQADQYSLGVIAYQMLSGKKPFVADMGPALMFQIMSVEPTPLHTVNPAVSPRTSEVVAKAMAKKPEDRFASCMEFAERLSESLNAARVGIPDPHTEATVTMPTVRTTGGGFLAQEGAREERLESGAGAPPRSSPGPEVASPEPVKSVLRAEAPKGREKRVDVPPPSDEPPSSSPRPIKMATYDSGGGRKTLALSMGIETKGGLFTKVIERHSVIPVRRSIRFSTIADNQMSVLIQIYHGERAMTSANRLLGVFQLWNILPAPRGIPQIEVTLDIDSNGFLTVTAKDLGTNTEQKITVTSSIELSSAEAERMVKEAEGHAAEDRKQRDTTEARNRADEMVHSVEKALNEHRSKISKAEVKEIEGAIEETRKAANSDDLSGINSAVDRLTTIGKLAQAMYTAASQQPGSVAGGLGSADGPAPGNSEGIFARIFKRGKVKQPPLRPEKGHDLEYALDIDSSRAIRGTQVRLTVTRHAECDTCHGSGSFGTGEVTAKCTGVGRSSRTETLEVRIPAGVRNGTRLRVPNKGHDGTMGAPPGDLYITTRVG